MDPLLYGFHDQVRERLSAVPGVLSAASIVVIPFLGSSVWMTHVVAEGQSEPEAANSPWFGLESASPEVFRTFGLPILRGRGFTDADRESAPKVAVISEGVARAVWPGTDPLGKRFKASGGSDSLVTVVGVVPDIHFREHRVATPMVYWPYRQMAAQGVFAIRGRDPLQSLLPAIRHALSELGPDAPIVSAQSMDELIAPQLGQPRLNALVFMAFALAALVLAAIGLYGIMTSAVSQRTREMGVRMALGATRGQVRQMVLFQALGISGVGAFVGLVGALASSRWLSSMLFEISPTDPSTLAGVSVLLLAVAGAAAYLPARRATKIDPVIALKSE